MSKNKEIVTPIEFITDEFINLVYNDYIDGFSIREILWRINRNGFNYTVNELNNVIDELNQYLL